VLADGIAIEAGQAAVGLDAAGARVAAALDTATGEERWGLRLDSFAEQLLADDEALYVSTDNAGLIAFATDPVPGTPAATPAQPGRATPSADRVRR
jgi:hypothetical protein